MACASILPAQLRSVFVVYSPLRSKYTCWLGTLGLIVFFRIMFKDSVGGEGIFYQFYQLNKCFCAP